jgi:catechol 2,3-dioxygenase-like lactoylglutathione lyase family enzyme
MASSAGLHHVTAICGDPRRNVAFYTRSLGLRMVKRTVNFDDPGAWHLYYGNEIGRPGTALTFFARGEVAAGRNGNGMAVETAFVIPEGSLGYWTQRLVEQNIPHDAPEKRFGQTVLPLRDPDGMRLALVAVNSADRIPGWSNGDVPVEHAVRGFHGVAVMIDAAEATARVLTHAFGFKAAGCEGHRQRFVAGGSELGIVVDLRAAPGFRPPRRRVGAPYRLPRRRRRRAGRHGCQDRGTRTSPYRPDRSLLFPVGLFPRARRRSVGDRDRRSGLHPRRAHGDAGERDQASALVRIPPRRDRGGAAAAGLTLGAAKRHVLGYRIAGRKAFLPAPDAVFIPSLHGGYGATTLS